MKSIREIAEQERKNFKDDRGMWIDSHTAGYFAESVLAAYLAQQEPVGHICGDLEPVIYEASKVSIGDALYLSPPVTAEMQLVPIEPTEAMITKGMAAMLGCVKSELSDLSPGMYAGYLHDVQQIYKAMLEAAKDQK